MTPRVKLHFLLYLVEWKVCNWQKTCGDRISHVAGGKTSVLADQKASDG